MECEICEKKYKTKNSLRQHMKIHYGEDFKCDLCDYKSCYKGNVKKHRLTHFKVTHECKCGKNFKQKQGLTNHLLKCQSGDIFKLIADDIMDKITKLKTKSDF